MAHPRLVVVGAGLAGVTAVETLRSEGFDGSVTMVGAEPHAPYERPPLSKGFLMGTESRESVFSHPDDWYREHAVELHTGVRVTAIDRNAQVVETAGSERIGYDGLLLATGSRPRGLDVPGTELVGVHQLRTLDASEGLKTALEDAERLVVAGGGWIGLEVAAAARIAGLDVVLVERGDVPLGGALGPRVAQVFADLHRDHGVGVLTHREVRRFLGHHGILEAVELDDGTRLDADLALVAVGAVPRTELAEAAGLAVDDGVLVDAHLRAADPRIFAAGDVANADHPVLGRRVRVEHWANARSQGPVAARAMLGQDVVHEDLPFFFTDQYELGMEYVGYAPPGAYERVVLRGDVAGLTFVAFWTSGDRVVAAMHVNTWDATEPLTELVRSGRNVGADRLADAAVPLAQL
ncbi:FAD-dependent oxidoreductase [Actinotalea sp. M2MS4P-6]|uniref:NAD(P)/FAD-dependent oxidoreductase n=1 Tax=Actinotalea sp. M2MS4P-6 TaxID=2983762 RepID=UPI0021E38812|nr:FAD-dependent oxidoreductase [Actinotalea sp. M2MS4P-6]MCV2394662.1 FAD-dependent oxidoreductase [Actinotalea sp. M2MS4P-6]